MSDLNKPFHETASDEILSWICKQPPAVSGCGGHMQTFKVVCAFFRKFRLSPSESFDYLSLYNRRCQPPWTFKELRHKIDDAYGKVFDAAPEDARPYIQADYFTSEWLELRAKAIERAAGICQICQSAKAKTAHHLSYRFGVLCPKEYLLAVCWPCHYRIHGNYRSPASRKTFEENSSPEHP